MRNLKNSQIRVALLISGGGTTAEAIIQAAQRGELEGIVPAVVIASRPDAAGIEKAKRLGVKVFVLDRTQLPGDDCFGKVLRATLKLAGVDLVSQNGWLPLTSEMVIDEYRERIINQHPGPLDPGRVDFGGKGMFGARVTCARLAYAWLTDSDYWTESTVHHVTEEFDTGSVIRTETLRIPMPSSRVTLADLEKNPDELTQATKTIQNILLPIEHQNVIAALRTFTQGSVPRVTRSPALISSENEHIVHEVKNLAARLFPGG